MLSKVPLELLLAEQLKVFNVLHVHVPGRTRMHGQREERWEGTGVFALTNFQSSVIQRKPLICGDLEERERSGRIHKRDELKGITVSRAGRKGNERARTAICLSCIYLMLCNTPPRIALYKSSVVVSG